MNLEIDSWLESVSNLDLSGMILRADGDAKRIEAALQFHCRKKASKKLPTLLKNPDFIFPTELSAEQCTSEPLAEFHSSLVDEGANVVDLTAGLGVDSIFMARKANRVTAIDLSNKCANALIHNANALDIRNLQVVNSDCVEWLSSQNEEFDFGYIDPYRRDDSGGRVFGLADCAPDVVANLDLLLSRCKKLIIKASPMLDISNTLGQLKGYVEKLFIVGTEKECKELLLVCGREVCERPTFEAVTQMKTGRVNRFAFRRERADYNAALANPATGLYLYEPYPAVMKSGAYDDLSQKFGVRALSHHTHLFVGESSIDFPGAEYEIESVLPFNKRSLSEIRRQFDHINVATRNFPIPSPELEKRLKTRPGGSKKLFGVTLKDGTKCLVITSQTSGR